MNPLVIDAAPRARANQSVFEEENDLRTSHQEPMRLVEENLLVHLETLTDPDALDDSVAHGDSSPQRRDFSWRGLLKSLRQDPGRSRRDAVLLLFSMDACRYELLSLKAIRKTAKVSDILEHVANCKEESLREQQYQGILVASFQDLVALDQAVAKYCGKRNSILVGVPQAGSTVTATRSAIQLLSDPLVEYNLKLHKYDAATWITKQKKRLQFMCENSVASETTPPPKVNQAARQHRSFFWNASRKRTTTTLVEEDESRRSTASS